MRGPSHIQPVVHTSLTVAEFYAGITCAKATKYLCYVLHELDALWEGPTPLYFNNQAAIMMINKTGPLCVLIILRSNILPFKNGKAMKELVMQHILGIINPSDDWL